MASDPGIRALTRAPLIRLSLEVMAGVVIFLVIASAAVGVSIYVRYLETIGLDVLIEYGLRAAEYALFCADFLLFLRFLWKSGCRIWKEL